MLYERIDVYARAADDEVIIYRCFRLLSGDEYVVQSADRLRQPYVASEAVAHESRIIELFLEDAPEARSPCRRTLQEAIEAFDKQFEFPDEPPN